MKQHPSRLMMCVTLLALLMTACGRQPQLARVEEVAFRSGSFGLVGDLRLPEGTGPFPVVVFVHGDSPADRTFFGMYLPIMERMLRAGYAVFSWDNPGIGESTGTTDRGQLIKQQAQIVLDAIEIMRADVDVDPQRIGTWGVSMAGYVMPRVLLMSEDVAFMICTSCPAMAGVDQGAYLTASQAFCGGVPEEKADQLSSLLSELERVRTYSTYDDYREYRTVLAALTEIGASTGGGDKREVIPEEAWQKNNPDNQHWWNPIEVIEQAKIPVLAIFGERDTQADPIQGAHAYQVALEQTGNPESRVEIIPGADHTLAVSATGCIAETQQTIEKVLQDQGYWPLSEAERRFVQEPGQHTPMSAYLYAPGYLDLIEGWLADLR